MYTSANLFSKLTHVSLSLEESWGGVEWIRRRTADLQDFQAEPNPQACSSLHRNGEIMSCKYVLESRLCFPKIVTLKSLWALLHRTSVDCLHPEEQLQGTRPSSSFHQYCRQVQSFRTVMSYCSLRCNCDKGLVFFLLLYLHLHYILGLVFYILLFILLIVL